AEFDCSTRGLLRTGHQKCDAALDQCRLPLQILTRADSACRSARGRDTPDMAPVDIVLVGGVDNLLTIRGVRDVLDFEFAGGKKRRGTALHRDGIEMTPAVLFPWEHDAAAIGPGKLLLGFESVEDATPAGIGLPDLTAVPIRNVRDADSPR